MSVLEKTSALKSVAGDWVCAGAAGVKDSSMGKSQSRFLVVSIREAWRTRAATQGFFHASRLVYGLGRQVVFRYSDREVGGRGFACANSVRARRDPRLKDRHD